MTKAFERISAGLAEALAFARGENVEGLMVHTRDAVSSEAAAVRLKTGLTQAQFAELLGSSIGTVRKWETGERAPSGAAARLLQLGRAAENRHRNARRPTGSAKARTPWPAACGGVRPQPPKIVRNALGFPIPITRGVRPAAPADLLFKGNDRSSLAPLRRFRQRPGRCGRQWLDFGFVRHFWHLRPILHVFLHQ